MNCPRDLTARWRLRAAELRDLGAEAPARTMETCADELDGAFEAHENAALTIDEAAAESGYAVGSLYNMVADGRVPNAGRKGAPRIRRRDLPRRPPERDPAGSDADALLREASEAMYKLRGAS